MNNKFNVLDHVLVYATIDSINVKGSQLVYSLKLVDCDDKVTSIDFMEEDQIQTMF